MRFVKMQGTANDYVVLDAFAEPDRAGAMADPALARALCDRRLGVGADGVIVLAPSARADASMRIVNADGSDGGMCGNGARCAAKFIVDRGYAAPTSDGAVTVLLGGRTLTVRVATNEHGIVIGACVDMGPPCAVPAEVPVDTGRLPPPRTVHEATEFTVHDRAAVFVSMGNPHMVAFVTERAEGLHLGAEGSRLEHHEAFPQRMNVHFVNRISNTEARMRTWERGVGETFGCGTGACAALVAGVLTGRLAPRAVIHMPGGPLEVEWNRDTDRVTLTGPAEEVFSGQWSAPPC